MLTQIDDDDLFHVAGLTRKEMEVLRLRDEEVPYVVAALTSAKICGSFTAIKFCLRGVLPNVNWPKTVPGLRNWIHQGIFILEEKAPRYTTALRWRNELMPLVNFLVDTLPLRTRGNASRFNEKYKAKILKFQLYCDMAGGIISMEAAPTSCINDGELYRSTGGLPGRGVGLADKAYVGCIRLVTPPKVYKNTQLSPVGRMFDKLCQICRSPVERCISRLHERWALMRFSIFGHETTIKLVNIIGRLESALRPPPPTERLKEIAPHHLHRQLTADQVTTITVSALIRHPNSFDLRTKNSAHRTKNTPQYKQHRAEV